MPPPHFRPPLATISQVYLPVLPISSGYLESALHIQGRILACIKDGRLLTAQVEPNISSPHAKGDIQKVVSDGLLSL